MACLEILSNGIYDYRKITSDIDRSATFINWYKNKNIRTYKEAKDSSFNATIPIDGILVGLGFSQSEEGFQEFNSFLETYNYQNQAERIKFDETVRTINEKVVAAWERCITAFGVHLWVIHTKNPYEFVLLGRYNDNGAGNKPKIKSIDFGRGDVKTNNGEFVKSNGRVNKKTILDGGILAQTFLRSDNKAFTLTVTPSQGDTIVYNFEEIIESVEPAEPIILQEGSLRNYNFRFDYYNNTNSDIAIQLYVEFDVAPTPNILGSIESFRLFRIKDINGNEERTRIGYQPGVAKLDGRLSVPILKVVKMKQGETATFEADIHLPAELAGKVISYEIKKAA